MRIEKNTKLKEKLRIKHDFLSLLIYLKIMKTDNLKEDPGPLRSSLSDKRLESFKVGEAGTSNIIHGQPRSVLF